MNSNKKNGSSLVISYLVLRKAIGILGIALPFVLYLGALLFFQTELRSSISSYYHTRMGDVFVGIIFAFGIFLYSYRGYERADDVAGFWGCIFAIGVALFPTTPAGEDRNVVGYLHLVFTVAFFATLIYFSLFLFVKSSIKEKPYPKKKQQRNIVYRVCGWVMIICMLGIAIGFFLDSAKAWLGGSLIFWMETLAIWAFGISWFTKGEAIGLLNDKD